MNTIPSILLAEASRGASLSESFRSHAGMGRDDVLLGLLMVATLAAGLWAASRLLGLRQRRHGFSSPRQLFRALCKAHHLTWSDRALLARVARHCGLRDPGRLFLESQRWEEHALGATFALDFVRLRSMRRQIFESAAHSGPADAVPRAAVTVRNASLERNIGAMFSDVKRGSEIAGSFGTGVRRQADSQQPNSLARNVASPLFPALPTPTLDLPPWTQSPSAES